MHPVVFRSRVDGWLAASLVATSAICLLAIVALALLESPRIVAMVTVLLPGVVLPVWLLCATDYRLDDSVLRIRCGPFSWRLPLRDIRAVTATRSPLSSPALSMDRLRIDHGRSRFVMISPEDKQAFIQELRRRVPTIQVHGITGC